MAWGSTFLFIKVADEALAPLQVSLGRVLIGAAMLLAILAARGGQLPSGARTWAKLAVAALLLNVAPFTLFAYGERHVSSVLAGIWNATVPLFTHVPHGVAARHVLSQLGLGVLGTGPDLPAQLLAGPRRRCDRHLDGRLRDPDRLDRAWDRGAGRAARLL